jgi:hypothetical protein
MKNEETRREEPQADEYAKFMRMLTGIVAVPKAAIYELDPRLRPKPRPISGEAKPEK